MLTGNVDLAIKKLGKMMAVVDELARVPRKVAVIAAPKITKLLHEQFDRGVDPYGRKWKKLATGRPAHLKGKTLDLSKGTKAIAMARGGIAIILGAWYGFFHQVSTRNMPARPILPKAGMPAEWRKVLTDASRQAFRQAVRK